MPIQRHLASGEQVVASAGDFYATDRRLIRYREDPLLGEELDSLEYGQIKGVRVGVRPRYIPMAVGFLIALLAMLLTPRVLPQQVGLAATLVGMGIALYGVMTRRMFLEFRGEGLNRRAQAKWRLWQVRDPKAGELFQAVRARLAPRQKGPA